MKSLCYCLFFTLFLVFTVSPAFTTEDKQLYLQQLAAWHPEKFRHPLLYRNARERVMVQMRESNHERVQTFLGRCDQHVAAPIPDFHDYHSKRHQAMNQVQDLAFAYALTAKKIYADRARIVLQQILNWPDWVYAEHKPRQVDLGVATVARCLAVCYDLFHDQLSSRERRTIETAVLQRALLPFHRIYADRAEDWTLAKHNWRSVICGKMGIAALIFWQKWPDARQAISFAIDGVSDVFECGDPAGGWEEGVHYWGYGIGEAAFFIEAMYDMSRGQIDLYQSSFLRKTGDFGLYMRTPDGSCFNFSDCEEHAPLAWLMALLANHYQNPFWQWSAVQEIGTEWPDLLFYNSSFVAKRPDSLARGCLFPGIQAATLRSSWLENALFLGLKSGRPLASHGHLDLNSFILHSNGRPLLVDLQTWPYAHSLGFFDFSDKRWNFESNHTMGHNTLLVDGQGQQAAITTVGHISNFHSGPDRQFAVMVADSAYGPLLSKFRRYVVMGGADFVLFVDDIHAAQPRNWEWLMHYQKEIEEQADGLLLIRNGPAALLIDFLRPAFADGRVVASTRSVTYYSGTYKNGGQLNPRVSIRPLHRQSSQRFIVLLLPFAGENTPRYSASIESETTENLALLVKINDRLYKIMIDFNTMQVQVI